MSSPRSRKQLVTVHPSNHPYHLVSLSPWPICISFSSFFFVIGFVSYINGYSLSLFNKNQIYLIGIISLVFSVILWFRDIVTESTYLGDHSHKVQKAILYGFYLFLITEIFFFVSLFWSFFHSSLNPCIEIGSKWPPEYIKTIHAFDLPFYNTIILLSSGITITFANHSMINGQRHNTLKGFIFTILFAILFIFCQFIEYWFSEFTISDSVYGSVFYILTGTHSFHVIFGTFFIIVSTFRIFNYHCTKNHHIGIETSILYWHFVDIIWIILFILIYWWN